MTVTGCSGRSAGKTVVLNYLCFLAYHISADLSVALQFGRAPLFFSDDIEWETFLVNTNLIRNQRKIVDDDRSLKVTAFIKDNLDARLYNLWADLREFSRVAHLACQTGGSLDPSMVNEAMVSTMYRLLHLSFPKSTTNQTLQLGSLAFAASIFLKGQADSRSHQRLAAKLRSALFRTDKASTVMPPEIRLWLLMILVYVSPPSVEDLWLVKMVDKVVYETKVACWLDALVMLKSVMWIDSLHNSFSKIIIEKSISRADGLSS